LRIGIVLRVADLNRWAKKMKSTPRRLALVKFRFPPAITAGNIARYPFKKDEAYVFLGEIPNMRGHCVVADRKSGKIHVGYHTELFSELSADEI
jgi:hypothetical protein